MRGHQGPCHTVLRRCCHTLGLRLGQHGIGGDDGDGGCLAQPLAGQGWLLPGHCGRAKPAELCPLFPGCCPEMRGLSDCSRSKRIDHSQRPHSDTRGQYAGGRPQPPFQIAGRGPEPCARGSKREIAARCVQRCPAKRLIRAVGPAFIAAVQKIKDDRPRHDRHPCCADGKAAPQGAQARHDAGSGIKAKGRSAGQENRIRLLHQFVRGQKLGFPRSRRAAHHMDRGHKGTVGRQHGDARAQARVIGIADPQARDIGDQVRWSGAHRGPCGSGPGVAPRSA